MKNRHRIATGLFFVLVAVLEANCSGATNIADHLLFPIEQIAHDDSTCGAQSMSCRQCGANEKCGWCVAPDGKGQCYAVTGSPKAEAHSPAACTGFWYPRVVDCPTTGFAPPDAAATLPPANPVR